MDVCDPKRHAGPCMRDMLCRLPRDIQTETEMVTASECAHVQVG